MNRTKILIAESGTGYGGSAKYLASLLPFLDKNAWNVQVVAYGKGPFTRQIERESQPVCYFTSWRFPWGAVKTKKLPAALDFILFSVTALFQLAVMLPVIVYWLNKNQFKLIHLNNEISSHIPLILAARLTRTKTLCHMHGWRNLTQSEKWVSKIIDQFIAVTHSGAKFYEEQLRGRKVLGVPNGMVFPKSSEKQEKGRALKRKGLGIEEDQFVISVIGRLIPLKGHSVFFRALKQALETNPKLRAWIVGEDTTKDKAFLARLEKDVLSLGLKGKVQFLGWQEDMEMIYAAGDAVVQPSIEPESFGYVALEGMYAGKPVIASAVGGLRDVVVDGESGVLVEEGNIEALANALLTVSSDASLASRLGRNAHERAVTFFSMTKNSARIQEIYHELLKRKRVLIAESGSGYGGTARYLADLVPHLNRDRFEPEVIAYGKGSKLKQIEKDGCRVSYHPSWRFPWGENPELKDEREEFAFRRRMHQVQSAVLGSLQIALLVPGIALDLLLRRSELIHLNNDIRSHIPLLMAASLVKIPVFCQLHGWKRFTRLEKWASNKVQAFAAISNPGAKYFSEQLKRLVSVVPNGISADGEMAQIHSQREELRREFGIDAQTRLVTMIGRFVPWKGQDVFIQAFKQALERCPNMKALLMGQDPTDGQKFLNGLKKTAESFGLSSKIIFLPWQDDVWQFYGASDMVVHASTKPEPFGLVVLEAMMAGKPVIATNAGGVPDLVIDQKTGVMVRPGDAGELADAIVNLANNHSLAKNLADEGRRFAREKFGIGQNAKQIEAIYSRLLSPLGHVLDEEAVPTSHGIKAGFKQVLFQSGLLRMARQSVSHKVPIVMYHRITHTQDPFFPAVSEQTFQEQMEYLSREYRPVSMDEWTTKRKDKDFRPENSVIITFDDGHAESWKIAVPILKKLRIPATMFMASDSLDRMPFIWTDLIRWWFKLTALRAYRFEHQHFAGEWNFESYHGKIQAAFEIIRYLKEISNHERLQIMSRLEKELKVPASKLPAQWTLNQKSLKGNWYEGASVGAHTISHPILSSVPNEEAEFEIKECKKKLEHIFNCEIKHFAYPNGEAADFTKDHERMVQSAGFESACSTVLGLNDEDADLYALKRVYAGDEPLAYFASRLAGIGG